VLRAVVVLKRRTGAGIRDAIGAFGIWLALSWVVTQACVRGLFQKEGVFLRTPKTKGEPNLWDALKANRAETCFAIALFAGAVAALVRGHGSGIVADTLAALLMFNAIAIGGAPYNSRAAMLADLPPELRNRRATERLRERITAIRPMPAVAAGGAFAGVAVLAAVLLLPATQTPHRGGTSGLLHQIRKGQVAPAPAPSQSTNPNAPATPGGASPSPGSTGSTAPTGAATPSAGPTTAPPTTKPSATPAPSPTTAPTPTPSSSPVAVAPAPSTTTALAQP
jgi:hypothetical protein